MKKKLTDNLGLKIGSVLFAAVLWLLVTNINNPSTPIRATNVPVKIINADLITSQGKIYEVLEDSDVINTVTIMAPRSIVGSISKDDIVAVADMKNLTNLNTIKIELSTSKYNDSLDSIRGSSDVVKLNIEEEKKISIPLTAATSGTLQDGYIVGDVSTDQNLVRISGPESAISRIKTAEVNVGITGFTNDIGTNVEIKLYDEEGNEIPKDNLTMNINNVGVRVEILTTKSVPVRFAASGTPKEGYRATGVVTVSPDTVLLAGKSNVLKNLSAIEIPDTVLDLSGASENVTTAVDIKEYLPGNVELGDAAFDGIVTAMAYIEQEVIRTITVLEQDIVVENMPEGYEGIVTSYAEEFPVQIRGLAADVNALDVTQVKSSVDIQKLLDTGVLEQVEEGYYDVNLSLNLPDTVSLKENITVRLNIKKQ